MTDKPTEARTKRIRPRCTEIVIGTGKKCNKPAIYYMDWGKCQTAVCGLCARRYTANALHPLRLKDWYKEVTHVNQ
jgi:hypothetical protein